MNNPATRGTYTPEEVAAIMIESAVAKHRSRLDIVFGKAVTAGVMLSYGGLLSQVLGAGSTSLNVSNPGLVKILSGFVFPVGLVMIVLQGADLLTSNMMTFPMAVMKRRIPWWSLPLNWFVVFWGNMVGSLFFAAVLSKYSAVITTEPYKSGIQEAAIKKALTPNWLEVFLRGIGCNYLVCIAIWQGATAKEVISKVVGIWIPIWVFVACSFDHVVANMFLVPLGALLDAEGLTAATYIKKSLFGALFGNIIGGLLVAVPFTYWYARDDPHSKKLEDAEAGEVVGQRALHRSAGSSMSAVEKGRQDIVT